jgi:hypothetical protein
MQFTLALAAIFAGVAFAAPAQVEDRQVPYTACSGLYGTSQCCATDVLGVADLDCANRKPPRAFHGHNDSINVLTCFVSPYCPN